MKVTHRLLWSAMLVATAWLQGCGGGTPLASSDSATNIPLSAGQLASPSTAAKVTHYAASRFAEQATFGATPALLAAIRAQGFETWIDEQFALPLNPIDMKPAKASFTYRFNDPLSIQAAGLLSHGVECSLGFGYFVPLVGG